MNGLHGGGERFVSHAIEPPMPIRTGLYRCEAFFHVDYVLKLYATEQQRVAWVLLSGEDLVIHVQHGTRVTKVGSAALHNRMNNHGAGGSSSNRFRNIRQDQLAIWVKTICATLGTHLVDSTTHKLSVDAVFVGHVGSDLVTQVLASSWLHALLTTELRRTGRLISLSEASLVALQARASIGRVAHEQDRAMQTELEALMAAPDVAAQERLIYGPVELRAGLADGTCKTLYLNAATCGWLTPAQLEDACALGCTIQKTSSPLSEASMLLDRTFGGALAVRWY